jgi:hypothetical protein
MILLRKNVQLLHIGFQKGSVTNRKQTGSLPGVLGELDKGGITEKVL